MPDLTSAAASAGLTRLAGALAVLRSIRCSPGDEPHYGAGPSAWPSAQRNGACATAELVRQIRRTPRLWACLRPTAPERCALFGWQRAIMSLPQAPGRKNVIERTLEAGGFAPPRVGGGFRRGRGPRWGGGGRPLLPAAWPCGPTPV